MKRVMMMVCAGLAAVLLGGCGGSSPSAAARAAAEASAAGDRGMVQFARCMRAHGVEMPDPFHRPGHSGLSLDLPEQEPATQSAYKLCGQFLEPVILNKVSHQPVLTGSERLALIHYAQCMRTHAVPMLDPNAQGSLNLGNVPGINSGFGRYTPRFRVADRECRVLLPATIHDDGSGP